LKVLSRGDGYSREVVHSVSCSQRALRLALAGFALAAGVAAPTAASAAEGCRIELDGDDAPVWRDAVAELRAALAAPGLPDDCGSVVIDVRGEGALLTFTASDGRATARELEYPFELVPTVQALCATTRPPPKAEVRTDAASEPRPPSPPPESDRGATSGRVLSSPYAMSPLFGAHVGFRSGADDLVSPIVGITGALLLDRWELGLLGRYEAHYVDNGGDNDDRPESSGAALGLTAGRREPAGAFDLRAGASVLIAALYEENAGKNGRAEVRLGAYGGGVWPRRSALRLRFDLGAELVPYNVGQSERNAAGSSSLPWWALTVAAGAEFR
jgi:hypothetical protein